MVHRATFWIIMKKFTDWTLIHVRKISFAIAMVLPFFVAAITANAQISTGLPVLSSAAKASGLLCSIMSVLFWVLISISIIMVLWGAWLYVTAGDDAKKPSEARMTILYAMIGIVVALAARGFPLVIASVFPGASVAGCAGTTSVTTVTKFAPVQ
jgi:hypothetical protein